MIGASLSDPLSGGRILPPLTMRFDMGGFAFDS